MQDIQLISLFLDGTIPGFCSLIGFVSHYIIATSPSQILLNITLYLIHNLYLALMAPGLALVLQPFSPLRIPLVG